MSNVDEAIKNADLLMSQSEVSADPAYVARTSAAAHNILLKALLLEIAGLRADLAKRG